MSATNERTWNQWEAELAETFRKWWPTAQGYEVLTTWKRDAAGKRRALRTTSDLAERRVTLVFSWLHPATREVRELRIVAEKRERAVENLAALARACEWLRLAEVRGIEGIVAILLRQMSGQPSAQSQQSQRNEQSQQQRPPLSSGPYAVLHITNDAPLAVAEAAYRAALREAHPDLPTGDHERAKALNAAIAAIRRDRATEYANRK